MRRFVTSMIDLWGDFVDVVEENQRVRYFDSFDGFVEGIGPSFRSMSKEERPSICRGRVVDR